MWNALNEKNRMALWQEKARSIKDNTNKWLWQEDRGFYKVHIHLDSLRHNFDEADMFAMGGNTLAIISGLAGTEKSRRIIQEALNRQKTYDVSSISGTLHPPYPKNYFKHPLLDDPYEYQNGAQWDWFGARLIYAMFQQGFSHNAKEKWLEIIHKNEDNRGFFEWDNKQGVGQGSDFYAGTAGVMGKVLMEGYFGIQLGWDHLSIEPKLGKDSANIHVYQPANDLFVAYEYTFIEEENKISLKYNSNFEQRGEIKILLPWIEIGKNQQDTDDKIEVLIDGVQSSHRTETKNLDIYIIFETDFRNRVAEIFYR
jgi:hypothetical protein